MSSSLRSASNASAAVFPDKKNCWLFSIFGVNMATPPKIPMFHAVFNSSCLIWEKILLRVFQNSAMRKAAARAAPNVGRNEPNSKFAAENAKGGLAAAFSSLAGGKRDYGAPRGAPESQEKLEKERRSAKSGRKAANRAPNATLDPCSEAPWRRFLPSCEQNRAKPQLPRKEKPAKRCEHLAGFDPNRPRTASSLPAAALRRG